MKVMKVLSVTALAVMVLTCFGTAQANVITGNLWRVSEAISQNATIANVPGTTSDVKFDVNSPLNFYGALLGFGYTIGDFLGSGGAFNIIENTSGTLTSPMDASGIGTLIDFKGFVTVSNGQSFSVAHDDGLTLVIGGLTVINVPGPTSPTVTTETYTGPSGNYAFELVYGECCGAPARLSVDLPLTNQVPEPGTILLLGSGLLGLVGFARKRNKK